MVHIGQPPGIQGRVEKDKVWRDNWKICSIVVVERKVGWVLAQVTCFFNPMAKGVNSENEIRTSISATVDHVLLVTEEL